MGGRVKSFMYNAKEIIATLNGADVIGDSSLH